MIRSAQRSKRNAAVARLLIAVAIAFGLAGGPWAGAQAQDAKVRELQKRVEQLEGQIVDLQVVIGTLESLARSPRGAAPSYNSNGADAGRVSALETQVQALAAQVEALSRGGRPNAAAPSTTFRPSTTPPSGPSGFGSTTVTPNTSDDPVGGIIKQNGFATQSLRDDSVSRRDLTAETEYETAYGALLQQNYAAAKAGFERFMKAYPRHRLAGNAQYWLGETYYVSGDYKEAATAFLKGYQSYANSPKAPDSLLKLAISLDRLGARDDACASLQAIGQRYPDAASHIRNRAASERRRLRCS
jgi:tol-pal system protein YbgF